MGRIKLHMPITVSSGDVERALIEQAKDEPKVARAQERLRGSSAQRAADELNRKLDIDVFDMLSRGWASVPSVRSALQLSAMMPGPPTIVRLEPAQRDVDPHFGARKPSGGHRAAASSTRATADCWCSRRGTGGSKWSVRTPCPRQSVAERAAYVQEVSDQRTLHQYRRRPSRSVPSSTHRY